MCNWTLLTLTKEVSSCLMFDWKQHILKNDASVSCEEWRWFVWLWSGDVNVVTGVMAGRVRSAWVTTGDIPTMQRKYLSTDCQSGGPCWHPTYGARIIENRFRSLVSQTANRCNSHQPTKRFLFAENTNHQVSMNNVKLIYTQYTANQYFVS